MNQKHFLIDRSTAVTDIVKQDYRTADVFRKYNISYCCGGKWPLEIVCDNQGLIVEDLIRELENAARTIPVSNQLDFMEWELDFILDYIINIQHQYLKQVFPELLLLVSDFARKHNEKLHYVSALETNLLDLKKKLFDEMNKEENILFPYIRQLAHAFKTRESYAVLIVRTLRKPVEKVMTSGHQSASLLLSAIRELTGNYSIPGNACTSHIIVLMKLKELDDHLAHHFHLEHSILLPKVRSIETDLLDSN